MKFHNIALFLFCFIVRYYVLYRLPNLTFLDSRPVKKDERDEAQRVGAHMKIVAPADNDLVSEMLTFKLIPLKYGCPPEA